VTSTPPTSISSSGRAWCPTIFRDGFGDRAGIGAVNAGAFDVRQAARLHVRARGGVGFISAGLAHVLVVGAET
jgi:hypothetical protein